ncbi:hypothetical protein [Pumilibacter muris]|uniref:hypothetical protein n=1 Tax=Pumilibacter muris TaxID=2941510 RepID=UPI0020417E4C|nr:hypothetical protein [Pumilibacter muris]
MFKVGALRRAGARRKPPTKAAARGGDRRQAVSGRRRKFCDCITATAVCPPMTKELCEKPKGFDSPSCRAGEREVPTPSGNCFLPCRQWLAFRSRGFMGYGRGGVERIPATERMAKGIIFAVALCVVREVSFDCK